MAHFYSSLLPVLITRSRWALLLLLVAAQGMALAQTITSLAPASGPVGTSVTITGTNLTGATSVRFNGTVQSTILSNTATSLAVAVPAGATTGLVTVTTAGGTSNGTSFTVTVVPLAITTVSPTANVRNALVNSPIIAAFNQALSSTSAAALKVYSAQRGGLRTRGTTPGVVSGSSLAYTPAQPWVAGETVLSTVTTAATSSAGGALAKAKVVRFTAAVAGTGRGIFSGATNYSIPVPNGNTDHLAMGDVDGDGDLDMLTANDNPNGTVSVRFNNGTGTFSGTQNVAVDGFPRVVELADVDGDGDLDFLAVNDVSSNSNSAYGSSVSVRFNNGAGVFSGTQNVETGDFSFGLAIGDLDGDGDLDFATANEASTDVRVRLNDGTGTFSAGITISLPGIYPQAVAMGDVDGDGDLDMLSSGGSGTVSVLLNNGNATFSVGTSASAYADYNLTLGDVDGDGDLDLVAAAQNSNSVQIRLNNGAGVFSGGQNIPVTTGPRSVALGDLDADGDLDLVTNNIGLTTNYGNTVSVRFNNGAGVFSAQATTPDLVVGTLPWHVALADIDGDNDLDVLTANNNSTVSLRFNGLGTAPTITSFTPASGLVGTLVTVTGTDLASTTAVKLNGVAIPSYTVVNTVTLTFTVPAGATSGLLTVTTPLGTATSATPFTVTVANAVPTITSLSPSAVPVNSGAFTLTMNGTGFVTGSVVNFLHGAVPTTFVSATQLTAAISATDLSGLADFNVTVTNPAPGGGTSGGARFQVYSPAPTITSFTPASGLPGTLVTVTGTNFTGTTAVTLNGVAVPSFSVATTTTLVFTVPATATTGLLAITTPVGTVTSPTAFTVLNPVPVLTSLLPNRVLVNTSSFTLMVNGSGFTASSVINFFGGPSATTFVSSTQLTTAIPNTYLTGLSQSTVTVTNPAPGGGTSAGLPFEVYLPAPTVTSFAPTSGPIGTTITVTGTDFQLVKYVGLAAPNSPYATSFAVLSPTLLSFVVPSGAASGPVGVTTSGGTGFSLNNFTVTATPNPVPTVTSLAPSTAVAGSGAFKLTVSGSGFTNNSVVNFNGAALPTTYSSATQLTAQVAASVVASAGSFGVTVTTPAPGGGTSAPATFTVTTPAPTLLSFAPASGLVGTAVTVAGTDLTGATTLTLNGTSVGSFTVVNATTLTFTVPAGATSGLLAVTTPGGTATSATAFTVLLHAPTITSLAPNSTVAGSGALTLTLSGTGFVAGSSVSFNGGTLTTTYVSATQLTAAVPASAVATAGSYGVAVANPTAALGGTSASVQFIVTTPTPTLLSFAPASGLVGTTVTVMGTNLTGATTVTLNGASVGSFAVLDAATLTFPVPAGATSGVVAVTTPGGTATSASSFTVLLPNPVPMLVSLSPSAVVAGSPAFTLTLSGTGFVAGSVVNLAGTVLPTAYVSATQLTAAVPASAVATAGSYGVAVGSPAPGGGISATVTLLVTVPAPTIASFSPLSGPIGTTVTVVGTNFSGTTAITLNGLAVGSFTVASATTASFVVPAGATSGAIAITTPGGTAVSADGFTVITPNPAPVIISLAPASAVAGSGALTLTITGTGFLGSSVVSFAGTPLPTAYASATQLTALVPAALLATPGGYDVLVSNPAPGGGASAPVTFTVAPPVPTLLSFAPASGLVGTTVMVTGTNLTGATTVTLNGSSVGSFVAVNATTLTFLVPVGATSGLVTVTTPGGTATGTTAFTVLLPNPVPTLVSLSPSTVVAGSGDFTLTANGTGFIAGSGLVFNGVLLTTTYVSGTQLTAQIPASAVATAGTVGVTVTTPAPGGGTSAAATFTVTTPAPTLLSFAPASGLVGTTVIVTGTNLTGATTVTLNGVSVGSFTVVNATTLTFIVPAGATSGLVAVTTLGGTATSASPFTVLLPNPVPTLLSLSPSTAVAGSPAFTLTLSGADFHSGAVVSFNATPLATTYVSATQLTAVVPAAALAVAGRYDVLVRNPAPGGGISASLPFVVTVPVPTISSFTPTAGGVGTLVTLTGTNLTGATEVRIGAVLIPSFTVVSATSLTLVIPASSSVVSGFITVITPGGTATSATVFSGVLVAAAHQALPELQVYPNPFQATLTIVLPSPAVAQVALYDMAGRLVVPLTPLQAAGQLLLPHDLATGVYLLEIQQGATISRRRLVRQ